MGLFKKASSKRSRNTNNLSLHQQQEQQYQNAQLAQRQFQSQLRENQNAYAHNNAQFNNPHLQHHQQFRTRQHHRFRASNLLGDPFALSTISLSMIGWAIALAGSVTVSASSQKFPVFTWWTIASEFLVIAAVVWITCTNNAHAYRLALLAGLATTTVYTTNSTNNFVYTSSSKFAAASAGYILLSIINVLWMVYFGTTDEARLHRVVDSYAVAKGAGGYSEYRRVPGQVHAGQGTRPSNPQIGRLAGPNPFASSAPAATAGPNPATGPGTDPNREKDPISSGPYRDSQPMDGNNPNGNGSMFVAAPLNAFENSSQFQDARVLGQSGFGGALHPSLNGQHYAYRPSTYADQTSSETSSGTTGTTSTPLNVNTPGNSGTTANNSGSHSGTIPNDHILATPTEYPYRARAEYSYTATDDNELSFHRHQILEVSDISGKWWQARTQDGEIGICPSNYMTLVGNGYEYGGSGYYG